MEVNGLRLPESFVALIDRPAPLDYWASKEEGNVDPYGHRFNDDCHLYASQEEIEEETNRLPISYHIADYTREEIEQADAEDADQPGWIPFITDFSKIVSFGRTSSGERYCFDFRDNPEGPSIILWDEPYWRRLAPNFEAFIGLFEPL